MILLILNSWKVDLRSCSEKYTILDLRDLFYLNVFYIYFLIELKHGILFLSTLQGKCGKKFMKTMMLVVFTSFTYFQIFNYMLIPNPYVIDLLTHILRGSENKWDML